MLIAFRNDEVGRISYATTLLVRSGIVASDGEDALKEEGCLVLA